VSAPPPRTPRHRFAHRLIVLFLVAGVLPLAGVGAVSVDRLNRESRDRSFANLRENAKATALTLSDRLDVAAARLTQAAATLDDGAVPEGPWSGRMLDDTFADAARFGPEGGGEALLGAPLARPRLSAEDLRILTVDKTVVRPRPGPDGRAEVWMARRLGPVVAEPAMLVGRVRPDFLWTVERMLPVGAGLCVMEAGTPLFCSMPDADRLAATVARRTDPTDPGRLTFRADGETYLASFWSLFMAGRFGNEPWVVLVAMPEDDVVGAGRTVARTYGLAVAAIVLVAVFIVLGRVRVRLEPLERLRNAARDIAGGNLGRRVTIDSGDEVEELGTAFNGMAGRLERQFKGLAVRAEIDRLILSSLDAGHIVETVLNRVHELVPCDAAAVLTVTDPGAREARLALNLPGAAAHPPEETIHLTPEEAADLAARPGGFAPAGPEARATYLEPLRAHGVRHFQVFPVVHREQLAAAIVLGHREPPAATDEDLREMREFTDRVAVALSNAAWEDKLYYQAHYDSLTGVPNRALLRDRTERALLGARGGTGQVAMLFLDVDRFKAVNDSLNHATGDQLLKHMAETLVRCVREDDTVVRFGGDEFVVLMPDLPAGAAGPHAVALVAERILGALQAPFNLEGRRVQVTASLGAALYPRDAGDFDELLRNADAAMYHAKASGRGTYRFYAPELNTAAAERLNLEQELRDALDAGQFRVFYQPQVATVDGRILGAEALVRWEHPEKGLVSPAVFVPVAEETGLIGPIGDWVMRTAAAQVRAWEAAGLPALRIGVNVAPVQLGEADLIDKVRRILRETGLPADRLEVEVTEGAIMSDTERNIATLKALRELGVRLSVDDFGTGYSSLSYLQRFPLNTLKVDQSFTRDMMDNPDSAAIAAAVVALGRSLGLTVIAEGVETEAQWAQLKAWGCEELQGYFFGRPMPADEFARVLADAAATADGADRPDAGQPVPGGRVPG
jgi:diguanylate cyclase (GGDEF)-like protein